MSKLLEVRDIVAGYGDNNILQGVTIDVEAGQIVTLIGPNGAGKSTVLKTVMGLLKPRGGSIKLSGQELAGREVEEIVSSGVGYVPQVENIFPNLTVEEHFRLAHSKPPAEEFERVMSFFPQLKPNLGKFAAVLSGGERQMLAIGRALIMKPKLILLDEPSAALAPQVVTTVFDRICAVARSGIGVLLVEQNVKAALPLSDYGYALQVGRNAIEAPGPDLLDDPRLNDVYLGKTPQARG